MKRKRKIKKKKENVSFLSKLLTALLPKDIRESMNKRLDKAYDEVRANILLLDNGMKELMNTGISLKNAKNICEEN